MQQRKGKLIPMNIDGATAVIYPKLGFAPPLARGVFCLSRAVGILADAWEQTRRKDRDKGPMPKQFGYKYEDSRAARREARHDVSATSRLSSLRPACSRQCRRNCVALVFPRNGGCQPRGIR